MVNAVQITYNSIAVNLCTFNPNFQLPLCEDNLNKNICIYHNNHQNCRQCQSPIHVLLLKIDLKQNMETNLTLIL